LRVSTAINQTFSQIIATAVDGGTVRLRIPDGYKADTVGFMASLENLTVQPDVVAKVVLNERTGTVVMGENVKISTVAVTHGNLSIEIREQKEVYPAFPFAPEPPGGMVTVVPPNEGVITAPGGQTVVTPQTEVKVEEEKRPLAVLPETTTIGELVRALNAIGVTPRDLITIVQAIKAAGALQAELEFI
jgi:flagellar P-ring protein precursor FlgI